VPQIILPEPENGTGGTGVFSTHRRSFQRQFPRLSKLENLNLGHTGLTDKGIHHLICLDLPSLAALSLSDAKISDDGVVQLCAHYALRSLDLYCVRNITKRSIDPIWKMKSLRSLGIGLSGITPDGTLNPDVRHLQRLLPRCEVDYGD
jgi:hypothetical protein